MVGHHGTTLALQSVDGRVSIDGDDEFAAEFPSGVKVSDMANMEEIEASIGERDAMARVAPVGYTLPKCFARKNFGLQ